MNRQEQLLEEILTHVKYFTEFYYKSHGVKQVEDNVYRVGVDKSKDVEVTNPNGLTFVTLSKDETVSPCKLNKNITINLMLMREQVQKNYLRPLVKN